MLPPKANADLIEAVNWARLHECHAAQTVPLRENRRLAHAAAELAAGKALHAALLSTGYLASQASALHLSGAASDSDVIRSLESNHCGILEDPHLTEMGAQRRERDVWLVLAAPAPVPARDDAEKIGRQILGLVNSARSVARYCGVKFFGASAALMQNPALTAAALAHSQEMAIYGEFDHRGHDGSSPGARVTRAGFGTFQLIGENIAAGAMTAADVTRGWLDSPPHCENIMDARFSETGIAFAVNRASPELVYWTQDFAQAHIREH